MTQRQTFQGAVQQAVQAERFSQFTTVVGFPERRPESQLQAEFAQRTGIWCPRPAREWLEHLMEHHGFTGRELAACWEAGSIGWSAQRDERRITTPQLEALFAYGVLGAFGIYCLSVVARGLFGSSAPDAPWTTFGLLALYFVMVCMTGRFVLWPRRVALRVRRASTSADGAQAAPAAS